MILQLLSFGSRCAEECASCVNQVGSCVVHLLVNEEIFLFGADRCGDAGDILLAEEVQHLDCHAAQTFHGTQQGRFLVQHLSGVGAEGCRNVECLVADKCRRSRIPCGVASRFKGGADTAGRKARRVGFALDELLAGEFHDDLIAVGGDEAVVLLGGHAGHGLEPVGEMRAAHFHCPVLHGIGDGGCNADVKRLTVLNGLFERLIGVMRQSCLHLLIIEYHAAEIFGYVCHTDLSSNIFIISKQKGAASIGAGKKPSSLTTPLPFDGAIIIPHF